MAVIDSTAPKVQDTNVTQRLWSALGANDTGKPVSFSKFSDKTVQFFGTFGSSPTIVMQGSNDSRADPDHADHASAAWASLTDAQGNAISKTAAALEVIEENPLWVQPMVTGGDGTTAIECSLVGKRTP